MPQQIHKYSPILFLQGLWLRYQAHVSGELNRDFSEIKEMIKSEALNPKPYLGLGVVLLLILGLIPWLALGIHYLQLSVEYLVAFILLFFMYCLIYLGHSAVKGSYTFAEYYKETCLIAWNHRQALLLKDTDIL